MNYKLSKNSQKYKCWEEYHKKVTEMIEKLTNKVKEHFQYKHIQISNDYGVWFDDGELFINKVDYKKKTRTTGHRRYKKTETSDLYEMVGTWREFKKTTEEGKIIEKIKKELGIEKKSRIIGEVEYLIGLGSYKMFEDDEYLYFQHSWEKTETDYIEIKESDFWFAYAEKLKKEGK